MSRGTRDDPTVKNLLRKFLTASPSLGEASTDSPFTLVHQTVLYQEGHRCDYVYQHS